MNLGIVCMCEGMLRMGMSGTSVNCSRCFKVFPRDEVETVLKLLRTANYEPSAPGQQAATEEERRTATNLAARKLAKLKLKVMDVDELCPEPVRPVPAPPVPYPVHRYHTTTVSTTGFGTNVVGAVYIHITLG